MSDNDPESAWWKTLLGGLFCIGISIFLYYYFTDLEQAGGQRRINAIVAAMYNLGGKWLTCSVFGLIGIGMVGLSIKEFKDQQ